MEPVERAAQRRFRRRTDRRRRDARRAASGVPVPLSNRSIPAARSGDSSPASRRPTTCSTASKANSMSRATGVAPDGARRSLPWEAVVSSQQNPGVPSVRIPAPLPPGVSQETIGARRSVAVGIRGDRRRMFLTSGYVYKSAAGPRWRSPARSTATSTRATAIRLSRCSRSACA